MSESGRDPWGDVPWSDGEAAVPGAPHETAQTVADPPGAAEPVGAIGPAEERRAGPWCAPPAPEGAARCSSCGAALAQRESIGNLVIPGLTAVDPALKDLDGRPLHLRGPSPTQGAASGLIVAAAAGGPAGLAILGGVGALAAAEYLGAGGSKGESHERVGETSEAVLQALERLERGVALRAGTDTTPRPELDAAAATGRAQSTGPRAKPGPDEKETVDGAS